MTTCTNCTKYLLLILALAFPSLLLAKQELRIGVGNFSPFFIEKGESGLFLEITKEIFKLMPEYEVKFVFMSNTRLLLEINAGTRIDAACNIFHGSDSNVYLSDPIFRYTDVAVSRKTKNLTINEISDLTGKSIAAYQGAKDLLGEEYKQMALTNSLYSEHALPSETTQLMAMGQKEVRIGDIYIFLHDISNKVYKLRTNLTADDFQIHRLWPDVYTYIAFTNEDIRNQANKAIQTIKGNGTLDRIYKEYEDYLTMRTEPNPGNASK